MTQEQAKRCLKLCDELENLGIYRCFTDSIRREAMRELYNEPIGGKGNPAFDHFENCGYKGC